MNRCGHAAVSSSSLFVDRIDRQDGGPSFNTRGFWQVRLFDKPRYQHGVLFAAR
jgi:hypothetical protein